MVKRSKLFSLLKEIIAPFIKLDNVISAHFLNSARMTSNSDSFRRLLVLIVSNLMGLTWNSWLDVDWRFHFVYDCQLFPFLSFFGYGAALFLASFIRCWISSKTFFRDLLPKQVHSFIELRMKWIIIELLFRHFGS